MQSSFATITIALFSAAFAITAIVALVWGAVTNEEVSSAAPLVGLVVVYNNGEAVNGAGCTVGEHSLVQKTMLEAITALLDDEPGHVRGRELRGGDPTWCESVSSSRDLCCRHTSHGSR